MKKVQKKSKFVPGRVLVLMVIGFFSFFSSIAQNTKLVSGKVTNSVTNLPVEGATVTVKGSTKGVATGPAGEFSITVPATAKTLVISNVGYGNIEASIGTSGIVNVKLVAGGEDLSEVVVVGYGTRKKETLTGSIATVDSKMFQNRDLYLIHYPPARDR
jgi:iron complex outermembrane receptor protein